MKGPHLIRTELTAGELGGLFAALAERQLRYGWLEFAARPMSSETHPALDAALRTVRCAGHEVLTRKSLRGPLVLGDLLREHFRGAAVVFVELAAGVSPSGELLTTPRLTRLDDLRWRLAGDDGEIELSTAELADRCRSPRPVGRSRRRR